MNIALYSLLILLGGLIGGVLARVFWTGREVGAYQEQMKNMAPLSRVLELEGALRAAQSAYQYESRARLQDIEQFSTALSVQNTKFEKHVEEYNKFLVRAALKGINGG